MEPVTTALQRGDWIGICIFLVLIFSAALIALWKRFSNEMKRNESLTSVVQKNTEAAQSTAQSLQGLCAEIKNAVSVSQQSNQTVLEALVKAVGQKPRRRRR